MYRGETSSDEEVTINRFTRSRLIQSEDDNPRPPVERVSLVEGGGQDPLYRSQAISKKSRGAEATPEPLEREGPQGQGRGGVEAVIL